MRETFEAIRVIGFWTVLWYRTGYRPFMRWMHRRHWHYMTVCTPHLRGEFFETVHWCHWCGLRATERYCIHVPQPGEQA